MTITIPADLEQELQSEATERNTSVEEVVIDALRWNLQMDPKLQDELAAWQEVRDEALDLQEVN